MYFTWLLQKTNIKIVTYEKNKTSHFKIAFFNIEQK